MEIELILKNIEIAINEVLVTKMNSLERGLNELNISSSLANCLTPLFNDYNVDAEYNGDIDKPNDRKALDIAKNRIRDISKKVNKDDNYKLSPDIIIHKQGNNQNNLVVIEVKKDTHEDKGKHYDLIKLEHLTINYLGNHYNYKLGVAIIFGTGPKAGTFDICFFQNGQNTSKENLI